MRFIKVSIILLFILSLLGAGSSLYLSVIRENEKEKRIHLEHVRAELESKLKQLEGEKEGLEHEVTDLQTENKDLESKNSELDELRKEALNQVREREKELKEVKINRDELKSSLETVTERNHELESVLDELDRKIEEMSKPKPLASPEVSYVGMEVSGTSKGNGTELSSSVQTTPEAAPKVEQVRTVERMREIPKPKQKKWNFLSFGKTGATKSQKPVVASVVPPKIVSNPTNQNVSTFTNTNLSTVPFIPSAPVAVPHTDVTMVQANTNSLVGPTSLTGSPEKSVWSEPGPSAKSGTLNQTQTTSTQVPIPTTSSKEKSSVAAGQVLLVNRNFHFAVTNLGLRQGFHLDDTLSVERKGAKIGQLRIEKIYDDYCAAYIIEEQSTTPIEEGDLVASAKSSQ